MRPRALMLCLGLSWGSLLGCGTRAAPAPEPAPPPAPVAEPEPEVVDDPQPEPPPRTLSDAELDAMEGSELEAACFAGSTAACDRLGH